MQNAIFNFKVKFHHEAGQIEQSYLSFFAAYSIFSYYKRSLLSKAGFSFFIKFSLILVNFLHRSHSIFFYGKYGTLTTQKVQQMQRATTILNNHMISTD